MSFIAPVATDSNGKPKSTGSMQALGKDDFLQLLVTKLENQDPLNPSDDQAFISELAQFSSLEQMNNIATELSTANNYSLMSSQSLNNSLAAGLIGKTVKADYSGVYVETTKSSTISFTSDQAAASVEFTVKDTSGNVVTTFTKNDVQKGVNAATWDGTDSKGNAVATGYYTITAKATMAGGQTFIPSMSVTGTVSKVVYRDGASFVEINGAEISLGDIREISES
ncbi:MAG: flagellar hook capping FlgD N-terminal domain-containing protein [Candidatus Zixiibacteriota bacterium]